MMLGWNFKIALIILAKVMEDPVSRFFPLTVSPKFKAGMLFSIYLVDTWTNDDTKELCPDSLLNFRYKICGSRKLGAHTPVADGLPESSNDDKLFFTFRSALTLQRPVLDPCLAVGFLPLPSSGLRVGQLVTIEWKVERLRNMENGAADNSDEVLYEVNVNSENWMIAGRKRGYVSLSTKKVPESWSQYCSCPWWLNMFVPRNLACQMSKKQV